MIWNLIFIAGVLYLAVALRGRFRFLKQMETRADDRITSLETQIGDLRDSWFSRTTEKLGKVLVWR